MKQIIAFIVSVSILMSCFALSVHAANDANDTVSAEELAELQACINNHGFSAKQMVASVLYDDDDSPAYIFASSEDGYAILDRGTLRFNECGDGNPYEDYMNCAKYYGGPLCYYVEATDAGLQPDEPENKYFDIRTQEYSDIIPKVLRSTENEKGVDTESPAKKGNDYFTLNNYDNLIRRKAYGYNNDGTCSAVATGIALNYIAQEYNMAIVPQGYISPYLDLNYGIPTKESDLSPNYLAAKMLHRYLTNTCGMGWMSTGYDITIPVSYYVDTLASERLGFEDHYCYNFNMNWTVSPRANTIKNNIIAGKPVLITTTILGHEYSWHTMCVYGFRNTLGKDELLVHSGWYSDVIPNSTPLKQKALWIDESYATFGHYFSFENPLAQFNDIPEYTNWAYRGILYVVHKNYMNGVTDTSFSPNGSMTRAMFATLLYRMAGSPSAAGLPNPYSDISSSSYYYDAVRWVTASGIANGTSLGVFSPDGLITREQLAVMLYRYANCCGYDTNAQADLTRFPDHASVSNYAVTAMCWAVAEGYITGVQIGGVDYLVPQNYSTRAQVATIISRFCNY